jgi:hypothetical protein
MPSGPTFNPSEIDDLVNDVQASDVAMDEIPVATPPPIEPALPPVEESGTVLEPAAVPIGSAVEVSAEVTLTQALEDHELFNDPGLEVARLAAGMTQDVIIPVEVGTRRFKLSLRLQLDDVN